MARPLRIEYADGIYHVTARGIERGRIVRDKVDRDRWVENLETVVKERGWRVFAFALMSNHFHVFFQTPDPNLCAGMRDLNGGYATYFNGRHGRNGHLFEGRYKAVVVEHEGHWIELSRYVHLNPVRARLVPGPEDWAWSSYSGYHRKTDRVDWVDYETLLTECGGDTKAGRRRHREYVQEGVARPPKSAFREAAFGLILGSDGFVARMANLMEGRGEAREVPQWRQLQRRVPLEAVIERTAEAFDNDRSSWAAGSRSDDIGRAVAADLACRLCHATKRQIADALGYRSQGSLHHARARVAMALESTSPRRKAARLERQLTNDY